MDERNMNKKKQTRRGISVIYLAMGLFLGLVIECLITVYDFSHGKWQESSPLEFASYIEEGKLELRGGATLEETDLVSRTSDASLIFHEMEDWGRIELILGKPMEYDTQLEWLYAPENGSFDRFRRQEGYLVKGSEKGVITIPDKKPGKLELDIHGGFDLKEIRITRRVSLNQSWGGDLLKHLNVVRLGLMALFFGLGIWLYADTWKGKREKKLSPEKTKENQRYVYLDAIRCLAAAMVIVVHVVQPLNHLCPFGSVRYIMVVMMTAVCLCCNILFILISAALLLPWKDEGWMEFLKKRFLKVFIPLVVYGMLYLKVCSITEAGIGFWIPYILRVWSTGDFTKGPHLWLVYMLLRSYLVVIPLRFMLKSMGEQSEKALTVLILGCLTVKTYGAWVGINFGQPMIFGEWTGVFLMGYLVNQKWMRKYDGLLLAGGAAAVLVSAYLVVKRADCIAIIANQSILSVLMSSAMFVLLLRLDQFLRPIGALLAAGSRYSYSILLVHWFVLIRIVYNGWFSSNMSQYLQILLPVLLCGAVSILLAWIIDRMVVDVIMGYRHFKKSMIE